MRNDKTGFVPADSQVLSAQERDCLEMTSLGLMPAGIAVRMGINEEQVEAMLATAGEKLGAQNRFMAVVRAIALGLIDSGPADPG